VRSCLSADVFKYSRDALAPVDLDAPSASTISVDPRAEPEFLGHPGKEPRYLLGAFESS
jgi:hypothetical protein